MLNEDLRAVALALGHHADVEAGVEEFARGELPEGEHGPVEVEPCFLLTGFLPEFGRLNGEPGPALTSPEPVTDLSERESSLRRWTRPSGWAGLRRQTVETKRFVFEGDRFRQLLGDAEMVLEVADPLRQVVRAEGL